MRAGRLWTNFAKSRKTLILSFGCLGAEILALADVLERGWKILDKSDPSESIRVKRGMEREREEKLIHSIKDWECRAADWVDSFAGPKLVTK